MKRLKSVEPRVSRAMLNNRAANWGNYVFKKDVYEVYVPYSQGHIVFKLLPGLNPADQGETVDPMKLDDDEFGSWQTYVRIVSCGDQGKTVTYCEQVDYWMPVPEETTPYGLAYNLCKSMENMDEGQRVSDWVALTKNGTATRPATMPKASIRTYAFCVPYWTSKGLYDHSLTKQKLHVLCLKKLASDALFEKCNKVWSKEPPIDLTDFATGPFISMWSGAAPNPYTGELGDPNNRKYNIKLFKTCPNTNISCDISSEKDSYLDLLDSWSQLFNFPNFEQQARYLMQVLPLDMLSQAWSDVDGYKDFVTEDMAKTLEAGKIQGWKKRQQRLQAQFQMSMPKSIVDTTKRKPALDSLLDDDDDIVEPPKPITTTSSIPGFSSSPAYPPVPSDYKELMDEVPFENESDDDDDDDDGLTDNRVKL